jgi:hypothetical protein
MPLEQSMAIRDSGMKRVLNQQLFDEISVGDMGELRALLMELCEKNSPDPIIVETNVPKDSFIMDKRYDSRDPDATFELILYGLDVMEESEVAHDQIPFLEVQVRNFRNALIGKRNLTPEEQGIVNEYNLHSSTALDSDVHRKLVEIAAILNVKDGPYERSSFQQASTETRFQHRVASPKEAGSPSYLMANRATLFCRIIGSRWNDVFEFMHYYKDFNKITGPVYYDVNMIRQTNVVSVSKLD